MFRGINHINLDEKGRMTIPTRYREFIKLHASNQLVTTIDTEDPCLLLYPLPDWEEIQRKVEALSTFNKATRRVQRLLIGHAVDVNIDSHGRILLPQALRDYISLEKHIVLVGQGKKFEIWDENYWQQQRNNWLEKNCDNLEQIPEELQSLSL